MVGFHMKIHRIILYSSIMVLYFILLQIFFPVWLNSPIKQGIDKLFTDLFLNTFSPFGHFRKV